MLIVQVIFIIRGQNQWTEDIAITKTLNKSVNLLFWLLHNYNKRMRASLVAQWLGICLPMQGTRVRALVWEDPTYRGATKPVSHNYWACASGACAPQRERPRRWEARAPRWRVAPARRNWRKPSHRNEDPTEPKININKWMNLKKKKKKKKKRIRLPMQGTRVWSLVREGPTCHGATKPMCHTTEPAL